MLEKSLMTLKKNPMIFIMMAAFMLIMAALSLPMISETNKMTDIYTEMYDFSGDYPQINMQDTMVMMLSSLKIFSYSLVLGILGLCFMSGYGNMVEAAMNEGKASLKIFFYGIRKFFGKVLLSALLLAGIIVGFSVVISLITTPLIIVGTLNRTFTSTNIFESQKVIQISTMVVTILLYPLLLMWFPAIFADRKDGVITCFKNGFRASRKRYLQLLPAVALMMLPTLLIYLFSENIFEMLETPYYLLIYPIQAIILPVVITYLFVMYQTVRSKTKLAR